MSATETRLSNREDLLILAKMQLDGDTQPHRISVRNLSAGGMMGEGDVAVEIGARLRVTLPEMGEIAGSVAWVQDNRFGVAFDEAIDPVESAADENP